MSWDVMERIMLTMLIISSNTALLICILTTKCQLNAFIYKGLMLNDDVKKIMVTYRELRIIRFYLHF